MPVPAATAAGLGLPDDVEVLLFDLDGVLTETATLHAAAWKEMFDEFLARWCADHGEPYAPFTMRDYLLHVDGKARADGVRSFLASRGIRLPEGDRADEPSAATVHGLGSRKNELIRRVIRERGVQPFEGARRYVEAARLAGLRRGVVSSSANATALLEASGMDRLFDVVIDGNTAVRDHLAGKPAPDMFLAGARHLGAGPETAAVFEDAIAGVQAGRRGGFRYVVGVGRGSHGGELLQEGADVVVADLAELLPT
ncbi:MAG: HAD family hydrolase [Actinomycetota bacterium]